MRKKWKNKSGIYWGFRQISQQKWRCLNSQILQSIDSGDFKRGCMIGSLLVTHIFFIMVSLWEYSRQHERYSYRFRCWVSDSDWDRRNTTSNKKGRRGSMGKLYYIEGKGNGARAGCLKNPLGKSYRPAGKKLFLREQRKNAGV